jgi:hypothetical protein
MTEYVYLYPYHVQRPVLLFVIVAFFGFGFLLDAPRQPQPADMGPPDLPDTVGPVHKIGDRCAGKPAYTIVSLSPKYDYSCGSHADLLIVHATGQVITLSGEDVGGFGKAKVFGKSFKADDGKTYRADGNGPIEVGTTFKSIDGKFYHVEDTGIIEVPPTGHPTGKWVNGYGQLVK